EGGEDAVLVHGVKAFDVRGGIRLCVTQRLRVFEACGIVYALVAHAGKDIVGGAVDNALQGSDAVCLHAVRKGADDGDAARAARLEIEPAAAAFGSSFQLRPVFGEHLLVGGDDALARFQRLDEEGLCRLDAAEELRDDGDLRVVHHSVDVRG